MDDNREAERRGGALLAKEKEYPTIQGSPNIALAERDNVDKLQCIARCGNRASGAARRGVVDWRGRARGETR